MNIQFAQEVAAAIGNPASPYNTSGLRLEAFKWAERKANDPTVTPRFRRRAENVARAIWSHAGHPIR